MAGVSIAKRYIILYKYRSFTIYRDVTKFVNQLERKIVMQRVLYSLLSYTMVLNRWTVVEGKYGSLGVRIAS